jgi:hypothetical protein
MVKQRDELTNCTFKPFTSSTPMSDSRRREDPFIFDRLSKSTKKFNPEFL